MALFRKEGAMVRAVWGRGNGGELGLRWRENCLLSQWLGRLKSQIVISKKQVYLIVWSEYAFHRHQRLPSADDSFTTAAQASVSSSARGATLLSRVTVSTAQVSDARAITALRTAVARDMTQRFGKGHWASCPTEAAALRELRTSHVLIARRGTKIIGTVRLAPQKPWAIDLSYFAVVSKATYIHGLAVAADSRGNGVARRLMIAIEKAARSWPADSLRVDAYDHEAGAAPFYLKCGFREVGRKTYRKVPLIYLEKLL